MLPGSFLYGVAVLMLTAHLPSGYVPAAQSHWVLSFLLHWTFVLELGIWVLALYLWCKRSRI
ncbi:hypothetical protein [Phaeobacter inhibens]|uniref:hypothetical protein n=1 Tax=Phaeobacter inhibens TaxID=221822 RepID=UPI000C9B6257|nr:hypothetical protein [Phaeobacter inhibens]UWR86651.1 hypothetical protein K4L05_19880 [Phaeobacter inhibens]